MLEIAQGWSLDVERGPDWLIVRVHCDPDKGWHSAPLAENAWSLLNQHFAHRLVLECDELTVMSTELIGELVRLQKRIVTGGGQLRIAGLSEGMRDVLHTARLDGCLSVFANREDAVMGVGYRPEKPR